MHAAPQCPDWPHLKHAALCLTPVAIGHALTGPLAAPKAAPIRGVLRMCFTAGARVSFDARNSKFRSSQRSKFAGRGVIMHEGWCMPQVLGQALFRRPRQLLVASALDTKALHTITHDYLARLFLIVIAATYPEQDSFGKAYSI